MDPDIFTFVDDSAEKISFETLFLIFIVWIFGNVFGLTALAIELLVNKWIQANAHRRQKI